MHISRKKICEIANFDNTKEMQDIMHALHA